MKPPWTRRLLRDVEASRGPFRRDPGVSPEPDHGSNDCWSCALFEEHRMARELAARDDLEDSNGSPWIALALVLGAMALLVVTALAVFRLVRG